MPFEQGAKSGSDERAGVFRMAQSACVCKAVILKRLQILKEAKFSVIIGYKACRRRNCDHLSGCTYLKYWTFRRLEILLKRTLVNSIVTGEAKERFGLKQDSAGQRLDGRGIGGLIRASASD